MLTICSACARCDEAVDVKPVYPTRPDFMATVAVPAIAAGDDARVALARHRAALTLANARLAQSADWYDRLAELK